MAMGMGGTAGVGPAGAAAASSGARGALSAGPGRGNASGRDVARSRPQRTAHTDFITPKYGFDQAGLRDFSIMGGLSNMLGGILAGNTYAGRMPQGFTTRGLGGRNERPETFAQAIMPKPMAAAPVASTPAVSAAPALPTLAQIFGNFTPRYAPGARTSIYKGV